MTFRCDLCGHAEGRPLFQATDRLFGGPGVFSLVRCAACTLVQTRPVPDDLSPYYPKDYPAYVPPPRLGRVPMWIRRIFDPACFRMPDLPCGSRVLEIGCGQGTFLAEIAGRGWDVTAVDLSPRAVALASRTGARTLVGTLESARFPDAHFDAVFAWMLVEHLRDPVSTLREVARVLRPGGTFAFSVPDAEFWPRVYRDRWFSLMVPTHLHHFTRHTLVELMRRAGLRPVRIIGQRSFMGHLSTLALLMNRRRWIDWLEAHTRVLRGATHPLACVLAALGLSDNLTVLARRPA